MKSNRTVNCDLRKSEFKALLSKDEAKIKAYARMAAAQEEILLYIIHRHI